MTPCHCGVQELRASTVALEAQAAEVAVQAEAGAIAHARAQEVEAAMAEMAALTAQLHIRCRRVCMSCRPSIFRARISLVG